MERKNKNVRRAAIQVQQQTTAVYKFIKPTRILK